MAPIATGAGAVHLSNFPTPRRRLIVRRAAAWRPLPIYASRHPSFGGAGAPPAVGHSHALAALPMTPFRIELVGAGIEFLDRFERAAAAAHAEFDCKAGRQSA